MFVVLKLCFKIIKKKLKMSKRVEEIFETFIEDKNIIEDNLVK